MKDMEKPYASYQVKEASLKRLRTLYSNPMTFWEGQTTSQQRPVVSRGSMGEHRGILRTVATPSIAAQWWVHVIICAC